MYFEYQPGKCYMKSQTIQCFLNIIQSSSEFKGCLRNVTYSTDIVLKIQEILSIFPDIVISPYFVQTLCSGVSNPFVSFVICLASAIIDAIFAAETVHIM